VPIVFRTGTMWLPGVLLDGCVLDGSYRTCDSMSGQDPSQKEDANQARKKT
jgi:hypothetical protein